VDTFDSESRRLSDAVPLGVSDGYEIGICDVGVGGRGQCSETVPSLRRQPDNRLQVAGSLATRRDGWASGAVASSAEFAIAQRCGDGESSAFDACGASGLGRPQDRQAAEGSGAGSRSGTLDGDGDLEAAWGRVGRTRWWPVRLYPLRAGAAKRVVADGLQGPCGLAHWPASSPDRARRSLALRRGACGLCNERTETVRHQLIIAFRRYGLPERLITDNGSPWGDGPGSPFTPLGVWLIEHGIKISHLREAGWYGTRCSSGDPSRSCRAYLTASPRPATPDRTRA
jgi:hypothetical protein